jgi:hypothetical protein
MIDATMMNMYILSFVMFNWIFNGKRNLLRKHRFVEELFKVETAE